MYLYRYSHIVTREAKYMNTIFCTGKELRELKRGQADFWVLYIANGEADFFVGADIFHASAGFVVIIGLTNANIQIKSSKDYSAYILQVKDSNAYEVIHRHLHLMNIADESISMIPSGRQQKNILTVFQNLVSQNNNIAAARELLHELMVRMYRASLRIVSGIHSNRMDLVADLKERLKRDYDQDITLESLAETYSISVSYLSHIFKDATGTPIMRYLLNCRIDAAKAYLAESNLTVGEIAKICGFHDISNFGRTFKKETGLSPRQYRKQHYISNT